MSTMLTLCDAGRMVPSASRRHAWTAVNLEHAIHDRLHMFDQQDLTNFLAMTRPNKPLQPTPGGW